LFRGDDLRFEQKIANPLRHSVLRALADPNAWNQHSRMELFGIGESPDAGDKLCQW
jgi:hypothetical protein